MKIGATLGNSAPSKSSNGNQALKLFLTTQKSSDAKEPHLRGVSLLWTEVGAVRELGRRELGDKRQTVGAPSPVGGTMSPTLLPEILDLIVDHLHNEPVALNACCFVSEPWVPRSRSHIFTHVELDSVRFSNSPAHYTAQSFLRDPEVVSTNVSA